MPLDELNNSEPYVVWPEIDASLLRTERPALPPFPLHLLPDKWRAWVEAKAQGFVPVDYVAQSLLGAVSAVCGGAFEVRVTPQWYEPLVLWQALAGERSSGKSPGLASARWLVEWIDPEEDEEIRKWRLPRLMADGSTEMLARATPDGRMGVVLWSEDLAGWMADASRGRERKLALAGWHAGEVRLAAAPRFPSVGLERFPLGIVGTLRLEDFASVLDDADDGLAAHFLYAWPETRSRALLQGPVAANEEMHRLLRRLYRAGGDAECPKTVSIEPAAVAKLEVLLPALRARMVEADGLEAAWIGKGAGTIARLATLLWLMRWAQDGGDALSGGVDAEHVEMAYALWSDYFLPHARAVLGYAGTAPVERLARLAVRRLRRARLEKVSLKNIRREALAERIDAAATEDVIELLESGGALRALATPKSGPQGGRPVRRWAVNPALREVSAVSAVSADGSAL